jgi:hypothetical protein
MSSGQYMKSFFVFILLVASIQAVANDEGATKPLPNAVEIMSDPTLVTLDQVVQEASNKESLIGQLENAIEKICAPVPEIDEKKELKNEREITSPGYLAKYADFSNPDSKLAKELNRYKIKSTIGDMNDLIDTKYFVGGASYQYVIEPAFRNREQLRKDVWTFNLGLRTPTRISLGTGVTVRFTFSRFYAGEGAKWKAIKACPYFISKTPLNSNQIKSKLRDGDGFRFEVIGTTGAAWGKSDSGNYEGSLGLGVKTEAIFLMDLYRLNQERARIRLLGIRNKGEFSIGVNLKSDSPWSALRGRLREALTLGLGGSFRKSISTLLLADKYPLDSMMVDYLYKFSTPAQVKLDEIKGRTDIGEAAIEQVFWQLRHLGFASLFFMPPGKNKNRDQTIGLKLLEKINISRDLAKTELERYRNTEIKADEMKVRTLFVGRMRSDIFAFDGRFWVSELISRKGQAGVLNSFVTSYDENIQPHYYYLNNSFQRSQTRKYLGRQRYNYSHDFDVLVESNFNYDVGKISDIVVRTEVQDTELDADEIKSLKNSLLRSLPKNFKDKEKIESFFPTHSLSTAFLSQRFVFGEEAFKAIGKIDKDQLSQQLFEFLDSHPEQKYMDFGNSGGSERGSMGGLGTFAQQRGYEIAHILNPEVTKEELEKNPNIGNEKSFEAFEIAKRSPLFDKYLIGEFFSSILPPENSENLFGVNLKLQSSDDEQTADISLDSGEKKVSPVYDAVSFLRAIITDPSLDMQMIGNRDHTGSGDWVPAKGAIALPPKAASVPKN